MPFKKNHEYRWKPNGEIALDKSPLCLKLDPVLKAQIKSIPDWQEKLRGVLPRLVSEWSELGDSSRR